MLFWRLSLEGIRGDGVGANGGMAVWGCCFGHLLVFEN